MENSVLLNNLFSLPSHLGSLLSITGVRLGEIYIFRQIEASEYPAAGPRSLMKREMPDKFAYDKFSQLGFYKKNLTHQSGGFRLFDCEKNK